MKDQIYCAIGLPHSELEALKTRYRYDGFNSYSFFLNMLNSYKSQSGRAGTIKKIIYHFTGLNLINVVGKDFFQLVSNYYIRYNTLCYTGWIKGIINYYES